MMVKEELDLIRRRHRGILRPVNVVEFAQDPQTALHDRFEWDNDKAGHEYRLWQAREIIRVNVIVLENVKEPIKAYVSLYDDRRKEGGGYRYIVDVLKNRELYEQLLSQALAEFELFRAKYQQLRELAPIFKAADGLKIKEKIA